MAKIVGPLQSVSAKGRFGEVALFSSWLGRSYVRVWRMHQKEPSLRQLAARKGLTVLSREWANLPEGAWEAWREFAKGQKPPVPAHCVFLSYALVARDAGLPMPTFPPVSDVPPRPELQVRREEGGKSLVVSWPLPLSLTPYPLSLLDLWLQVSRACRQAYERHYKHILYVPVSEGQVVIQGLPSKSVCHIEARFILSDANRSKFSRLSA